MTRVTLERRVQSLEVQVSELQDQLQSMRQAKDWRRTIGAFTDDEGMKEILREAMGLREADRKKTRPRGTGRRSNNR
jgi:hypothetical protein